MGYEPSDESKCTQAGPDKVGEPEDDESKDGEVSEEFVSGHHPAIGRCAVLRFMQSTEENCGSECRGPDECARIDQPSPCKASKSEPGQHVSKFTRVGVRVVHYPSICVVRRYKKENPAP